MAGGKRARYNELRLEHFTPREARELSTLSKNTPALKLVREARQTRWARFERIAAAKISQGKWRRGQVGAKWIKNLSRMYTKNNWRVQEGPTGDQPRMAKHSPNPWAMYRSAEKAAGGPGSKGYISPWEVVAIRPRGESRLERGLIFVQQMERRARREEGSGLSMTQLRSWIEQKEAAISEAKGRRKEQLIIEKNRLERLLAK